MPVFSSIVFPGFPTASVRLYHPPNHRHLSSPVAYEAVSRLQVIRCFRPTFFGRPAPRAMRALVGVIGIRLPPSCQVTFFTTLLHPLVFIPRSAQTERLCVGDILAFAFQSHSNGMRTWFTFLCAAACSVEAPLLLLNSKREACGATSTPIWAHSTSRSPADSATAPSFRLVRAG